VQLSALSVRYRRLGGDAELERGEDLLGELIPRDVRGESVATSSFDRNAAHAVDPAEET
jgi:hypothetical protein